MGESVQCVHAVTICNVFVWWPWYLRSLIGKSSFISMSLVLHSSPPSPPSWSTLSWLRQPPACADVDLRLPFSDVYCFQELPPCRVPFPLQHLCIDEGNIQWFFRQTGMITTIVLTPLIPDIHVTCIETMFWETSTHISTWLSNVLFIALCTAHCV